MSGKNGEDGAGEGSGTLRDDAGSSGQETTRGWGVLIRKASEKRKELSTRVAAAPPQNDPVSEISGLTPLKEFLSPVEGDNEVIWIDEENRELTGFQIRVLDRMKELRDKREDIALEEGDSGSKVKMLDTELLNLKAFLNTAGSGALDGSSVMFDVSMIAERAKRDSEAPRESAHNIAPALEREGVTVPGPVGLGVGGQAPGGAEGTRVWNTLAMGPVEMEFFGEEGQGEGPAVLEEGPRESSLPVSASMIEEEVDEDGVDDLFEEGAVSPPELGSRENEVDDTFEGRATLPPRPVRVEEGQEEADVLIGGYPVLPLNKKEKELLSKPDELGQIELTEMAAERRWQVEVLEKGLGITEWEKYEWLMRLHGELESEGRSGEETWARINAELDCRLEEADALEAEADLRNPANQKIAAPPLKTRQVKVEVEPIDGEGVPAGTIIQAGGKKQEAVGPVGGGVPRQEPPTRITETVLGVRAVIEKVARENSEIINIRELAAAQEGKKRSIAPDIFAGFEEDFEAAVREGSAPLDITHIMGEGAGRGRDPASRRLPTVELKADRGIAHLEGTGIRRITPGEAAETLLAPRESLGEIDVRAPRASAAGRLPVVEETAELSPVEDFSRYGDIFYAMEQVYLESGEKVEPGKLEDFEARMERAIGLAEEIASSVVTIYDGDLGGVSPEMRRAQRLRSFKKEFIETAEGESGPKKDLNSYRIWLERKKAEFRKVDGVFETLGISAGEYSRKGIRRVCDAALQEWDIDSAQKERVKGLAQMLEENKSEWDIDEFAAERNAELAYEMVVGFGTKKERELGKARIAEILRLEAELKEKKIEINTYLDKRSQMVRILSDIHAMNRKEEEITKEMIRELGRELQGLEPDYEKRKKLMASMFSALAGEGEIGKDLMRKADEKAAGKLGVSRITTGKAEATEAPGKRHGPIASGLGSAIKMAAGAGILAAGLWLGQQGITLPSFGSGAPEKEVAAEVADAPEEEARLPAGVEDVDTGMETIEQAEETPALEEPQEEEVQEHEAEEGEYSRDGEGLSKALDAKCQEERGLLVSGKMLRAAYASIEGELDGSVLPADAEWAQLMLKMRFPDRIVTLAVMSDLARKNIENAEKYAAFMRLAVILGNRAGGPKSFGASIQEANAKGLGLPELDNEFPVGQFENARTGHRCLAAAYHSRAVEQMGNIRSAAIEEGMGRGEFDAAVDALLGRDSKRVREAYDAAVFSANREMKRDYCRALTRGKGGTEALERAIGKVLPSWEKSWKKVKKEQQRQQELNGIIGEAPQGVKANGKRAAPARASPCAGIEGTALYSCVAEQNLKTQQAKKDEGEKKMHTPKPKKSRERPQVQKLRRD